MTILPGLVLAPLVLAGAFRIFGWNLLFPLHFFADFGALLLAAFVPALVLLTASGIPVVLRARIVREYDFWQAKPFAIVAVAMGRRKDRILRRLVLLKAFTASWSQGLPWLFGELIIVETVFNAPGLGLDAWHLARVRDLEGLGEAVLWLALLYGVCVALSAAVNHWIGRRLETYA